MQPNEPQKHPRAFDITGPQPKPNNPPENTSVNNNSLPSNSLGAQQPNEPPAQPNNTYIPPAEQPKIDHLPDGALNKKKKREDIKNIFLTLGLFILAPLFAILMIVFVFQSYVVDGSSMEPTLHNGNRVFILKLPKTLANIQDKKYIPGRNEIIVFKKPNDSNGTQLIKRVIGLPGDRVVIKDGTVTVYNAENPNGFNVDDNTDYGKNIAKIDTFGKTITQSVGENELFVLGDNRNPGGSLDSHSGLGLVPVDNIVGRLWVRYYPLNQFQIFASESVKFLESSRILLEKYSLV